MGEMFPCRNHDECQYVRYVLPALFYVSMETKLVECTDVRNPVASSRLLVKVVGMVKEVGFLLDLSTGPRLTKSPIVSVHPHNYHELDMSAK